MGIFFDILLQLVGLTAFAASLGNDNPEGCAIMDQGLYANAAVTIATPDDRTLVVSCHFHANPDAVFAAFTQPRQLRQWLLGPNGWVLDVCLVDLRVGGASRYIWRAANGAVIGMGGKFLAIDQPNMLSSTLVFDDDWTGGPTISTITLVETQGVTHLRNRLVHPTAAALRLALDFKMEQGMALHYNRLAGWISQ